MRPILRTKALAVLLIPLVALVAVSAGFALLLRDERRVVEQVNATIDVRRQIQEVLTLVVDQQAAARGYLLTRDQTFLEPLEAAEERLPEVLAHLEERVADRSDQRARAERIVALAAQRRQLIQEQLAVGPGGDRARLDRLIEEGKETSDEVRRLVAEMQAAEVAVLDEREREADRAAGLLTATVALGLLLGIAGGVLASVLFSRSVVRRLQLLQRAADDLAAGRPVQARPVGSDEIGALGTELVRAGELLGNSQAQLREARDDAQRANRAKDDFLSRMSHELRTPLNGILGFAQLLGMDDLTAQQRDSLDHIHRAGRHLLGLINDVLDISRIETGRLAVSPEPVQVTAVVTEAWSLVRQAAQARDLRFEDEVAGQPGLHVRADQQRLKQVLINLLSNAVKYNVPGGFVRVSADAMLEPAREGGPAWVRLLVTDAGHGIPEGGAARLFQPFERLDAGAGAIEGVGLGLALSKALVEAMGGTISVSSAPGHGSTFCVALPADTPVDAGRVVATRELPDERPGEDRTRGRVLYIEDNGSNIALARRVLERRPGVELVVAVDGASGISAARQQPPDLILLDLDLPDVRGEDVLMSLMRDPRTVGVPVVVVTADASGHLRGRLRAMGARAHLTKPLDVTRLLDLVDAAVAAREVHR